MTAAVRSVAAATAGEEVEHQLRRLVGPLQVVQEHE